MKVRESIFHFAYYKSWIWKLVDECYDYTYSFLKHTTLIHGKFLYLIGMICINNATCQKNVFLHVNMFVVILDRWHIIKNCMGPPALGPKDEKLLVPKGPTLHLLLDHVSSLISETIHGNSLITTIKKNKIVYLIFNVKLNIFTNSLSSIFTPTFLHL